MNTARALPLVPEFLTPGVRLFLPSLALTALLVSVPWAAGGPEWCGAFMMLGIHIHVLLSYLFHARVLMRRPPAWRAAYLAAFAAASGAFVWTLVRVLDPRLGILLILICFAFHHCRDEVKMRLEAGNGYRWLPFGPRAWAAAATYALGFSWCYLSGLGEWIERLARQPQGPDRALAMAIAAAVPTAFLLSLCLHLAFPPENGRAWVSRISAAGFLALVLAYVHGAIPRPHPLVLYIALLWHHGCISYLYHYGKMRERAAETAPGSGVLALLERVRTEAPVFLAVVLLAHAAALGILALYFGGFLPGEPADFFIPFRYQVLVAWSGPHIVLGFFPRPAPADLPARPSLCQPAALPA